MTSFLALLPLILLLCLVTTAVGNDDDAPPDFSGFDGGGKPCPNFRCSSGQSPVQKSRTKFVSTGCSKMGGGMMAMGGGMGMGNEKYATCCDRWHACYQTCGAAKTTCDAGFKSCSAEVCGPDDECKKSADLSSMMLGLGGCRLYDQGQYGACECVSKDKVEEKRASALRSFYKRYASPESVGKVDALAKKVDSVSKMAALFRKLHVKYPKSIRVEVDDEMARMQEMMKKMEKDDSNKKVPGDTTVVVDEEDEDGGDEGETEEL